jgi:transposase
MHKQRENDGRGLGQKSLTELRIRAMEAVVNGKPVVEVAEIFGVNRTTVYDWKKLFEEGGWEALEAGKRGGRPGALSDQEAREIAKLVRNKNPLQLEFEFALWTREMVRELIRKKFGKRLSLVTVGRLLKAEGLSVQRPLFRAWQQDPARVDAWLKKDYPQIRALARKNKAEIYFGDEAGLRSDHHAGRTWGVRGKTPVIKATGARFSVNMISAVSPLGNLRFMVVEGTVNAGRFIEFLRRLIHNRKRPVYLIVDGHPAHKARKVKEFVASMSDRLQLFCLPPYSPELNPDELVWNYAKNHRVGRMTPLSKAEMKAAVVGTLRSLQKRKDLVRSMFRHPETAYAA